MTFEEIYRSNCGFVWGSLRRLGVAERDVEDAVQKVFLIVFRKLPLFEGRSSLRTWLCGIALRVASDYRKSAALRNETLVDEPPSGCSPGNDPGAAMEEREKLRELDRVLSRLPLEQRDVLVLFELQGLSGDDIAELLGIPTGTVRSRLRLARQAFSRVVAERDQRVYRTAVGGEP